MGASQAAHHHGSRPVAKYCNTPDSTAAPTRQPRLSRRKAGAWSEIDSTLHRPRRARSQVCAERNGPFASVCPSLSNRCSSARRALRLAGLAKAFPQQEILVTTWVVVYRGQSLKAVLRVKGWSLEAERCEKDLPTAASASLVLCCPEEFRPQAPATSRLLHPELPNLAATAPGTPANPSDDLLSVVSHENRQPLAVRYPRHA